MAAPLNPSVFAPIAIGALILWRFYSRVRRMVGRQKFSDIRPWITIVVFPLLTIFLTVVSFAKPLALMALGAGVVAGIALGLYGIRATRFEKTPEGLFYTPSAHIGIALSVLFMGRIIYRLVQMNAFQGANPATGGPPAHFATTPATLVIFGLLAGYYVSYAIGLLRWKNRSGQNAVPVPGARS